MRSLAYRHSLGLHQPKGLRIALLRAHARYLVERVMEPAPLPGDLGFRGSQFRQAPRHFHTSAISMFPFCSRLDTTPPRRLQASPAPPACPPGAGACRRPPPLLLKEAVATHEGSAPDAARQSLRPRGRHRPNPRPAWWPPRWRSSPCAAAASTGACSILPISFRSMARISRRLRYPLRPTSTFSFTKAAHAAPTALADCQAGFFATSLGKPRKCPYKSVGDFREFGEGKPLRRLKSGAP